MVKVSSEYGQGIVKDNQVDLEHFVSSSKEEQMRYTLFHILFVFLHVHVLEKGAAPNPNESALDFVISTTT